ncbi:cellulose biosynthesis protein BcsF [Ewingella sp. S1.OA.A_B6]
MNINDIIEIFILAAVIFIPFGMMLHRRLPIWKRNFAARYLSPRYLTPVTAKHLKTPVAKTADNSAAAALLSLNGKSNTPS